MTMPSLGIDAEVTARLCASLDRLTERMDRRAALQQLAMQAMRQVPFYGSITLSGGAGTDDQPDKLQPKTGYVWSIRRITAQGYSAGTVTAYLNSTNGEPVMPFPAAAVNTLGRGELLVQSGERLVWGATGITGTVTYWGRADCMEQWLLPFYLGHTLAFD